MYFYSLYGLVVESNTEFPQLLELKRDNEETVPADIRIEITEESTLREKYAGHLEKGAVHHFTENGVWFHNQAGDFLIETVDGQTLMLCEKFADTDIGVARSFLMGNCIALAMTQRKKVVLHGSTLCFGDKTVLVCGDSGTGKSTTAMALIDEGARLMADDISVIDIDPSGVAYAYPAFPEQKLCRDAAVSRGLDLDELRYIDEERDKFSYLRHDIFVNEKRKVDNMISLHLASSNRDESEFDKGVRLAKIDGAEKVNAVTDRFFLDWLYGYELTLEPAEMMKCVALAAQIDVIDVTRVNGMDTKEVLIKKLVKQLQDQE
jgi:hypothetical protein